MRRITTGLGGRGSLQGEKSHVSEKMTCWSGPKKKNLFQDLLNLTSDQPPLWKGETTANENIPIRLSDHINQAEIINQKGETLWLAMWKPQLGIQCVTAVVGLRERILYDYFEIRSSPRTRKCRSWERKSWLLRGEGSCQKEKCLLFCTQQKKGRVEAVCVIYSSFICILTNGTGKQTGLKNFTSFLIIQTLLQSWSPAKSDFVIFFTTFYTLLFYSHLCASINDDLFSNSKW